MKRRKPQELVAVALRHYAEQMLEEPGMYSRDQAQELDRALRSCPGITDIDEVWSRWRFTGEPRGWLTDGELVRSLRYGGSFYPV